MRFRFNPDHAARILKDRQLELWENSLSDTWIEVLGSLVPKYTRMVQQSSVKLEFRAYLAGVIRHIVISNARDLKLIPKDSAAAMIQAYCKSSKQVTRRSHMARMKFHLWNKVENEILSCCGEKRFGRLYPKMHHVVDYFFDQGQMGHISITKIHIILRRICKG